MKIAIIAILIDARLYTIEGYISCITPATPDTAGQKAIINQPKPDLIDIDAAELSRFSRWLLRLSAALPHY